MEIQDEGRKRTKQNGVALWQTRLLMEAHPVFEFLDVESMVFEQREEYYRQIRSAQESGKADGLLVLEGDKRTAVYRFILKQDR